jgi:glycosyltransferase involved in cell wall biosynthesis
VNILVLNWQDRHNPQAGGAEIHLHEIFGRLAARGHRVTLLASGFPGAAPRETVDGIDVHRVGGRHSYTLLARPYYRRELAREHFDVVIEDLNKVPLFSPLWAKEPVVLLVHHLFGVTAFREASAPIAAATWLLERPIPRIYRGLPTEAVSESTADDLVRRGLRREDIRVIHNGVDLGFYTPDPATARLAEPTFLYLGRLRRYKRVDLIVRAISELRSRGVAARLLIAGKGDYELELRALAQRLELGEAVRFLGFISDEEKRTLLRSVWANVFTSPKEGWGITNLEAAACGTPSVASNSPGLRESVQDGRTGILVPHGDIPALADALGRLARHPEEVERMGAEAIRFAAGFSWDAAADATERHLEEVIRGGHTPTLQESR